MCRPWRSKCYRASASRCAVNPSAWSLPRCACSPNTTGRATNWSFARDSCPPRAERPGPWFAPKICSPPASRPPHRGRRTSLRLPQSRFDALARVERHAADDRVRRPPSRRPSPRGLVFTETVSIAPITERRQLGDRFVVEREVGRGGAGIVYRAYDLQSERIVALKVIASEAGDVPEEEACFTREGQLLEKLDHPGIVKIVGFGVFDENGLPFVAMEWLEGEDLAARQKREPLTIPQAVELTVQVAEALQTAHAAGVIHRDIKPGNLFLCKAPENEGCLGPWRVKLVDFGVAARSDIRITRMGDVVGTPAYMAPEQARGDAPIDARCDIYSLGATLFELVANRPPHVGPTPIATLARLVTTSPPRLRELRRNVPPMLDNLIHRMLSGDAMERPGTAQEMAE